MHWIPTRWTSDRGIVDLLVVEDGAVDLFRKNLQWGQITDVWLSGYAGSFISERHGPFFKNGCAEKKVELIMNSLKDVQMT
jgi:hypothetical protein